MNDGFLQWFHAKQDEALAKLQREDPKCEACANFVPCPCGCGFGWCKWLDEMAGDQSACEYEAFELKAGDW